MNPDAEEMIAKLNRKIAADMGGFTLEVVDRIYDPRNLGRMPEATGHARITGPCGDTMEIWLLVTGGRTNRATFMTDGCGPTIACGSMATELVTGRSAEGAASVEQKDILDALGGLPEESQHCALLASNTLKKAILDHSNRQHANEKEIQKMRIAIPTAGGRLAMHFGHCEAFAMVDVDTEKKEVLATEMLQAPEHQPGMLPPWLAERGANVIIAGGMGQRALSLFAGHGIEVVVGAPAEEPETIAKAYLAGTLATGGNVCDH